MSSHHLSTGAPIAAFPSKSFAYWIWQSDDGGNFFVFSKEMSIQLEKRYKAHQAHFALAAANGIANVSTMGYMNTVVPTSNPRVHMPIGSTLYEFDVASLTQRNTVTNTIRIIHRIPPIVVPTIVTNTTYGAAQSSTPRFVWQWSQGTFFTDYDPIVSAKIENAFNSDALVVNVDANCGIGINLKIHFGHMHQVNTDTGATRSIRRVDRGAHPVVGVPLSSSPVVAGDSLGHNLGFKRSRSEDTFQSSPPRVPTLGRSSDAYIHSPISIEAWQKYESILFLRTVSQFTLSKEAQRGGTASNIRVAAFDMDDTLIMSKSGKVFPQGADDWKYVHPSIPSRLKDLHNQGYRVVIFSNQSGIGKGGHWNSSKAKEIQTKIIDVANDLQIPLSAWVSTQEDRYRKPLLGMWMHYTSLLTTAVDLSNSFYCGDAAGRLGLTLSGRAKDFSCSDRKFAYNIGIQFKTPEDFFTPSLTAPPPSWTWDGIGPDDLKAIPTAYSPQLLNSLSGVAASTSLQCVIFVGFPGSGKSSFYNRFFSHAGFVHVSRDVLKDTKKCVAFASSSMAKGQSVVIDNTNPSVADRSQYIVAAQLHKASVHIIFFRTSRAMAQHMNTVRDVANISPKIPTIAYNMYECKFQAPQPQEGADSVIDVPLTIDFSGLPDTVKNCFFTLS